MYRNNGKTNIWLNGDGKDSAGRYLSKRTMSAGSTATLRKAMKAQRIAGEDILTPTKVTPHRLSGNQCRAMNPGRA